MTEQALAVARAAVALIGREMNAKPAAARLVEEAPVPAKPAVGSIISDVDTLAEAARALGADSAHRVIPAVVVRLTPVWGPQARGSGGARRGGWIRGLGGEG